MLDMRKGGRLKPGKDANEQQRPTRITCLQNIKETDRDVENSMKKIARKSFKAISF
jgi:hypothetical protein